MQIHLWWVKSSHRRCSVRKGVLRNFAKFTGKHLCQSLFFHEVADQAKCFTEHLRRLLLVGVWFLFSFDSSRNSTSQKVLGVNYLSLDKSGVNQRVVCKNLPRFSHLLSVLSYFFKQLPHYVIPAQICNKICPAWPTLWLSHSVVATLLCNTTCPAL